MIVVGLTGSIAMGKSTAAAMFRRLGWPLFDADEAVHRFYRSPAAQQVEDAFPGVLIDGAVDRTRLAQKVLGDGEALQRLEAIVHPAVAQYRKAFLAAAAEARRPAVVLDIPLLMETHGEAAVDVVVVVSASDEAQRGRALARPGMTVEKLAAIRAKQRPEAEKRRRAHYVIDTDATLASTEKQVEDFVRAIVGIAGGRRRTK